ncbi:MAG: hypothetical protein ACP6KW_00930 [Candidatus Thorarchaeota archaeon]
MKLLDTFILDLGKKREMPVEVLVDTESTIVLLDCKCCREFVSSRLPGGALIPIASALKAFFESRGMRNTSVNVNDFTMRRTYKGVVDKSDLPELTEILEQAVAKFTKRRKGR